MLLGAGATGLEDVIAVVVVIVALELFDPGSVLEVLGFE